MSEQQTRLDLTESIKLGFESTKQLTTLNAGSIVVIGTFLSNIFPTDSLGALTVPLYIKLFVGAAFVGFGASLIFSTLEMYLIHRFLNFHLRTGGYTPEGLSRGASIALLLPLAPFTGGLICFSVAVILNLFFGS